MSLELERPPIDEVVVSLVLDRALGPDAVGAGRYLAARGDRFVRHEIHEPITATPSFTIGTGPVRVWLLSADGAWLVQLQEDRFSGNWRRRGDAVYPGFTRAGGAMSFVLDEFARFQSFCAEQHDGVVPRPVSFEMAKIDVLQQGRHWRDAADAAALLPVLQGPQQHMKKPGHQVMLRWQEEVEDGTLTVSVIPARMKTDDAPAWRLEVRFVGPVTGDLRDHLVRTNAILNEAFERLVPASERARFT